jgi:hypothetical protein
MRTPHRVPAHPSERRPPGADRDLIARRAFSRPCQACGSRWASRIVVLLRILSQTLADDAGGSRSAAGASPSRRSGSPEQLVDDHALGRIESLAQRRELGAVVRPRDPVAARNQAARGGLPDSDVWRAQHRGEHRIAPGLKGAREGVRQTDLPAWRALRPGLLQPAASSCATRSATSMTASSDQ